MSQIKRVEVTELEAAAIKALQAYGSIESRLALILATLLKIEYQDGLILINRVASTKARYNLIDDFIKKQIPTVRHFWAILERRISYVEQERNWIAHWRFVTDLGTLPGNEEPTDKLVRMDNYSDERFRNAEHLNKAREEAVRISIILIHFEGFIKWCLANNDPTGHAHFSIFMADEKTLQTEEALIKIHRLTEEKTAEKEANQAQTS